MQRWHTFAKHAACARTQTDTDTDTNTDTDTDTDTDTNTHTHTQTVVLLQMQDTLLDDDDMASAIKGSGCVLFCDASGFTRLTERLSIRVRS